MHDYLEELCNIAEIELIYNENKLVILSATIKNEKPIIRAHYIFSKATREIARLIVGYYTGMDLNEKDLAVIYNFALSRLETSRVKIIPPDIEFLRFFKKKTDIMVDEIMEEESKKSQSQEDENIKETNIKSIIEKDLYGNISSRRFDNKVDTKEKDFIELDIIIERYKA